MHSLLLSTAEITTGSLWRARLHSPPSLLTNTFRHSDQAKHSRSCLGQLLQLPKILSQRAPTTIMPTFNCGGSVNHLLSSCLLSQASPSPHLCRDCLGLPRSPVVMAPGVPQAQPQKPSNHMYSSLSCPFCAPDLAAGFDEGCSGTLTAQKAVGIQMQTQHYCSKGCVPSALAFQITSFTCILRVFSVVYLFSSSKEKMIIERIIHQHLFHPNIGSELTCI